AIARALILRPKMLVCDEPTSALDVSVQAQILELFTELKQDFGLTYLFISHNLAVVERIADRIAVMYRGEIVEQGETNAFFAEPIRPRATMRPASVPPTTAGRPSRAVSRRGARRRPRGAEPWRLSAPIWLPVGNWRSPSGRSTRAISSPRS